MSQATRTDFVPKGDVCIYSPGGVVRSVGSAATAAARGALLVTAKAAASSGDTIVVGPGTYTHATAQLFKNGVNWKFVDSDVTLSRNTNGGLFDDSSYGANTAISCTISGTGKFTRTCTNSLLTEANAVIILDNNSSAVSFTCKSLNETGGGAAANGCVRHNGGSLDLQFDEMLSTNGNGIWWSDGDLRAKGNRIATGRSCFYSTADPQVGTFAFPSVYTSGHAWIDVPQIIKTGLGGDVGAVITLWAESFSPIPRVWIKASLIEDRGVSPAIWSQGGYLYVRAEKVFNSKSTSSSGSACAILNAIDAKLWANIDKIVGGYDGAVQFTSGEAWVRCQELSDPTDFTSTAPLVLASTNDTGNAGKLHLDYMTLTKNANGDGIKCNEAINAINVFPGKTLTQSGYYDLNNAAGTINLHGGGSGTNSGAYTISGVINRLGAGAYSQADLALLSQVFN